MDLVHQDESQNFLSSQTSEDLEKLLNKEELLIRSEFHEHVKAARQFEWAMVVSSALMLIGCICFAATAILFLGTFLEWWKASLIVALLFISAGGFIYGAGKEKEGTAGKLPKRALSTLNEMRHALHEGITQH